MTADRVKAVLAAAGLPVTLRTLEDCLWLASQLPVGPPATPGIVLGGKGTPVGPLVGSDPVPDDETGSESPRAETLPEPVAALRISRPGPRTGSSARRVRVPAAPMLPRPLSLQRALRPLKIRVPSQRDSEINEEATAARIADSGRWDPVLTGVPERWFDLVLVADTSPSMALWQPMVRELHSAFRQTGAFRDVRLVYLADGEVVYPGSGAQRPPAAIVDPAGRRAVLVFSDCGGGHWWRGTALKALRTWASHGPTAVLQPLPEPMWQRTAAPAVTGWARSPRAGAPSSLLKFTADLTAAPLDTGIVPVPVLEIAPSWLRDWARLVTGPDQGWMRTSVACLPPEPGLERSPLIEQETSLTSRERVLRFQASASTEAVRLAAHFAVAVPALPVMRHIQQCMMTDPKPSQLAEVLLSGLLRPIGPELYEFIGEEARLALLTVLPRSESWQTIRVLQEVSAEIEQTAGTVTTTFPAWLEELGSSPAGPGGTRFALVSQVAVNALSNLAIPLRPQPAPAPQQPTSRSASRPPSSDYDRPLFFLSYARSSSSASEGDADFWVQKFFDDLSRIISDISPERGHGFMQGSSVRAGSAWPQEIGRALAECRVFVPLLSRRYFTSKWCGKEWGAFQQRALRENRRRVTGIVPALWTGLDRLDIPDVVQQIQYSSSPLPAAYGAVGLYGLMKLTRYADGYRETLHNLARTIVDAAERAPIPLGRPIDWDSAPDAFADYQSQRPLPVAIVTAPSARRPSSGPGYYGNSEWDWAPFSTGSDSSPLYSSVRSTIAKLGFRAVESTIEDLQQDGSGLLFIDPWAVNESATQEMLASFDARRLPGVSVIVPFNLEDLVTLESQTRLEGRLRSLLPYSRTDFISAGSPDEFARKLRRVVHDRPTYVRGETDG